MKLTPEADAIDNEKRKTLRSAAVATATLAMPRSLYAMSTSNSLANTSREITSLNALALSDAIRERTFSCVEVMTAYLNQISVLNPEFNAIVSLQPEDQLLQQAKDCDRELAAGSYRGWMHGFPHAVKDLANAKGLRTTNGSPIFADNIATSDSTHIARIKQAGAIMVGKTNVPEFGLGSQTYNEVFGPTYCAYDGFSTAGGSSGGAASALALQIVPVADGSDLMGSLRNPGAFNNVIGFRPTPGLVPLSPGFIEQLPCNGPMGRTVRDTARLLSTMAGYDPAKPTSLYRDPSEFAKPLDRDFKGTRIGWLGDYKGYLATEPGLMPLCEKALDAFETIGCEVEQADLGYSMEKLWQTWLTFRHWLVESRSRPLYDDPEKRKLLKPEVVWEIEGSFKLRAEDISDASANRAEWYHTLRAAFEHYDYLVLPTAQVFPFDARVHWPKEINGRTMDTYHRWMEVVIGGTLSGCPVINVPAGFSAKGLPMGLQIIAPRHHDFSALQIAHAYEQATRWNLDNPPPVLTKR